MIRSEAELSFDWIAFKRASWAAQMERRIGFALPASRAGPRRKPRRPSPPGGDTTASATACGTGAFASGEPIAARCKGAGAIVDRALAHALLAVPGAVLHQRFAKLAAGHPPCLGEVGHAVADVGLGIGEFRERAAEAQHRRGRGKHLHEPDLADAADGARVVGALDHRDRVGDRRRQTAALGFAGQHLAIEAAPARVADRQVGGGERPPDRRLGRRRNFRRWRQVQGIARACARRREQNASEERQRSPATDQVRLLLMRHAVSLARQMWNSAPQGHVRSTHEGNIGCLAFARGKAASDHIDAVP
jgi:hypothetical protein